MGKFTISTFVRAWADVAKRVHDTANANGFWDEAKTNDLNLVISSKLCLVHSEISEGLEAVRHGQPADDKLVQHPALGVEMADAIIRLMDLATFLNIDLPTIIEDKVRYNKSRPFKHGKTF